MKSFSFIVAFSLMLGGCSWITDYLGGDENIEPPKELVEIKNAIAIEQLWSVDTGEGSGEQLLHLSPAIDDKHVYTATRDGNLQAYRLVDGEQVWQVESGQQITAGPGLRSGILLVGTRNSEVIAFSVADGKQLWSKVLSGEVLSVPEMRKNLAVVRTGDGRVTALNLKDGKKRWDFYKPVPSLTLRGTSKPVITSDSVISGFDNGELVSITLEDGRQKWRRKIAVARGRTELERMVDLDADPVVYDGMVYAAAFQVNVAAVRLQDGRIRWQRDLSSHAGLSVSASQLYVTDDSSQVWALHVRNGASLWRQDQLQFRGLTAPVVFDDYVVVGDFEGYLHWLRKEDGKIVARMRGDNKGFLAKPQVSGNMLISLGKDGELSAFRLQSGQ